MAQGGRTESVFGSGGIQIGTVSWVTFLEADPERLVCKWFVKAVLLGETSRWTGGAGQRTGRVGKTPSKGDIPGDVPALTCFPGQFWGIDDTADFVQPLGKAFIVPPIVCSCCRVEDTEPRSLWLSA